MTSIAAVAWVSCRTGEIPRPVALVQLASWLGPTAVRCYLLHIACSGITPSLSRILCSMVSVALYMMSNTLFLYACVCPKLMVARPEDSLSKWIHPTSPEGYCYHKAQTEICEFIGQRHDHAHAHAHFRNAIIELCKLPASSTWRVWHALSEVLLPMQDVKKAGVGISGDAQKLMRDFGLQCAGLVDLSEEANSRTCSAASGAVPEKWSLASKQPPPGAQLCRTPRQM